MTNVEYKKKNKQNKIRNCGKAKSADQQPKLWEEPIMLKAYKRQTAY